MAMFVMCAPANEELAIVKWSVSCKGPECRQLQSEDGGKNQVKEKT